MSTVDGWPGRRGLGWGVVKSPGFNGAGPVSLVRTQNFGIQSEKPTLDGVPARSSTSVFGGTADIAFQAGHVGS
jgi:hypothetical protein